MKNFVLQTQEGFATITQSGGPFWSTRLARMALVYLLFQYLTENRTYYLATRDTDTSLLTFLGESRVDVLEPDLHVDMNEAMFLTGCRQILKALLEIETIEPFAFDSNFQLTNLTICQWAGDNIVVNLTTLPRNG